MGLWGVLWEILKAVGPHAAPHVARAVTRRKSGDVDQRAQAVAEKISKSFATMEERVAAAETNAIAAEHAAAAAEERAATLEERFSLAQAQFADRWTVAGRWLVALLVWNVAVTGVLIYLLIARR